MPQWEYLFVTQVMPDTFDWEHTADVYANGVVVQSATRPAFYEYCNGLGAAGWEIVIAQNNAGEIFMVFRRPK